jgi:hypothetical protein
MRNQVDRFSLNLKIGFVVGLTITQILFFTTMGFAQEKAPSDRPDWTHRTTFEKDSYIYFTGGFLNGADYPLSIRCANAEALKVATQSISQYIRSVFSMYSQGINTGSSGIERFVEDGIATLVNNLHLQGIRQKEVYFEKAQSNQGRSTYDVFVMLEISQQDYVKAKTAVLERLKDQLETIGETEAKEKAEKLLEELKKGVDKKSQKGV